jgi:hypothetical protein
LVLPGILDCTRLHGLEQLLNHASRSATCLSNARQRRSVDTTAPDTREGSHPERPTSILRSHHLSAVAHPLRPMRPQRHIRARKPARDSLPECGEDWYQSRDAQPLVHRLHSLFHRRRLGGESVRRTAAPCQRCHRSSTIWGEIVAWLHRTTPSLPMAPPTGVIERQASFPGDIEPERHEWFLQGTQSLSP